MLQSLTIENYALIEHLEFEPVKGLNVITGETGAGKSIIMGALGLILGQRADAKAVRTGATKCVIEATFDISGYGLETLFEENELDMDETSTIIRREIYATGKSRAFVNDIPVQLTTLKALGDALIDIHSQHQNLLIGKDTFQQEVIDTLANNVKERDEYLNTYRALQALRKKIAAQKEENARNAQEADYIRFQYKQLEEANLKARELEEMEQEQEMLSHAEEIKGGLCNLNELLNGEGQSILNQLNLARHEVQGLTRIYPSLQELAERLESDYIDLKDAADEIESQANQVNYDPERLAYIEERLSTLYDLLKKHGKEKVEELILLRDDLNEKMMHLDNSDEEIAALEAELKSLTDQATKLAAALTATRQKAAKSFEKALIEKVSYLGMPNVQFQVSISPLKDFTASGLDNILFLFSANKNQALKPCGEVASGGEISRLMLSIKALIANATTLPTIIFDEIDTGVSGDIADRMGDVMSQMSAHLQVITITHLPQVAGKGDAHFMVYKEDSATDTTTHINRLADDDRLREIARMLSGSKITEQAIENAKTLMK